MTEISLSDDLAERIEGRIDGTEFDGVDEYAEFVLGEVLARVEHDAAESQEETASREQVQNRLQSLGYLEE
ncbi:hypothetical protein ACOZ4L_09260 [Haloplanus ruber]|uniref:CopG family transcriptional regulator n=1 Tax=Haloplanus ruber TaxID=869892 RepID=A0ABD6CWX0_9EURY|nr:hypothetical protein [Haloplanus ruber]